MTRRKELIISILLDIITLGWFWRNWWSHKSMTKTYPERVKRKVSFSLFKRLFELIDWMDTEIDRDRAVLFKESLFARNAAFHASMFQRPYYNEIWAFTPWGWWRACRLIKRYKKSQGLPYKYHWTQKYPKQIAGIGATIAVISMGFIIAYWCGTPQIYLYVGFGLSMLGVLISMTALLIQSQAKKLTQKI